MAEILTFFTSRHGLTTYSLVFEQSGYNAKILLQVFFAVAIGNNVDDFASKSSNVSTIPMYMVIELVLKRSPICIVFEKCSKSPKIVNINNIYIKACKRLFQSTIPYKDLRGSSPAQEDCNREKGWLEARGAQHNTWMTSYLTMDVSRTLHAKPLGVSR
jgi:hypothetical protein